MALIGVWTRLTGSLGISHLIIASRLLGKRCLDESRKPDADASLKRRTPLPDVGEIADLRNLTPVFIGICRIGVRFLGEAACTIEHHPISSRPATALIERAHFPVGLGRAFVERSRVRGQGCGRWRPTALLQTVKGQRPDRAISVRRAWLARKAFVEQPALNESACHGGEPTRFGRVGSPLLPGLRARPLRETMDIAFVERSVPARPSALWTHRSRVPYSFDRKRPTWRTPMNPRTWGSATRDVDQDPIRPSLVERLHAG